MSAFFLVQPRVSLYPRFLKNSPIPPLGSVQCNVGANPTFERRSSSNWSLNSSVLIQSSTLLKQESSFAVAIRRGAKSSTLRKVQQLQLSPHLSAALSRKHTKKEMTHTQRALAFCDDHYFKVYGSKWHSMRLALLSRPTTCALWNNFNVTRNSLNGDSEPLAVDEEHVVELGPIYFENVVESEQDIEETSTNGQNELMDRPRPNSKRDEEEDEEFVEEPLPLLSPSSSASRLISVEEQILGESEWDASALHDFVPSKKLMGEEDYYDDEHYYQNYQYMRQELMPHLKVTKKRAAIFPEHLHLFMSKEPRLRMEQPSEKSPSGTWPYLCFNPASLIQVLALDLRPNDSVLVHRCQSTAAVLALLQSLLPSKVVCNLAKTPGKGEELRDLLNACDKGPDLGKTLETMSMEPEQVCLIQPHAFSKILLEAPCFEDRRSLHDNNNNLFNPKRKRDRLLISEQQASLLVSAIKCLDVGGSVVYSTRTLSPVQNDGVVMSALKTIWEETKINVVVEDLNPTVEALNPLLEVHRSSDYKVGCLITPSITKNVGPLYLSRITRRP